MTRIDEELWPAKEPCCGFAAATVECMLVAQPLPHNSSRHGRWMVLAMAALFVSGAAYGWGIRGQVSRLPTEPVAVLSHIEVTATMQQRVPRIGVPRAPELEKRPSVRASLRSSAPAAARLLEPVAPPSSPRIPACQCERGFSDVICDCY